MMNLHQALGWLPSARLVGDGSVKALRVTTDTRSLQAGDLFVALKGERFDAHDFWHRPRHKARWQPLLTTAWPRRACPAWKCPTRGWRWDVWLPAGGHNFTCPSWR